MKAVFETFLIEMYNDVPGYTYEVLFYLLCIFIVVSLALAGRNKGLRWITRFALGEYIFLTYCSTVLFRAKIEETGYNFMPFWSYMAYDGNERPYLLPENIMNVVVFIPHGILLACSFRSMKWWLALLIGMGISLSIEMAQYVFKLGFSETDDVIHNTTGCMIGYGLFRLIERVSVKWRRG